MKVSLYNFKCWEEKIFDLGDDNFTLLTGKSGVGKTTIFDAISFVLYGKGQKVIMHGKKSCKVIFEYKDVKIERSKRPNIVKLNDVYEDDAAQEMINKKFGENFDITGYIKQGNHNSFILMGPLEKLAFLENFAFKDINLIGMKQKISSIIKKRNDNYVHVMSRIATIKEMIESIPKPDVIEFPIKCKESQREKSIKNNKIKIKNCITRIKKLKIGYKSISDAVNYSTLYHDKIKMMKTQLETIQGRINNMNEELQDIDINVMRSDLVKYKKELKIIDDNREYNDLVKKYEIDKKQYDDLLLQETDQVNKEIDNIESQLWKEYTIEEINDNIDTYTSLVDDLETIIRLKDQHDKIENHDGYIPQINKLVKKIDDKKELIAKIKLESDTYNCPSCHERIMFKDGDLVKNINEKCTHDIDDERRKLSKYKKELSELMEKDSKVKVQKQKKTDLYNQMEELYNQYDIFDESREFDIQDYKTELGEYTNYRNKQYDLEKQLNKLRENEGSNTLKSLEKTLNNMRKQIEHIHIFDNDLKNTDGLDENELRNEIALIISSIPKYERMFKDVETMETEENEIKMNLEKWEKDFISKYKKVRKPEELQEKLNEIEKEIEEKEIDKRKFEKIEVDIDIYLKGKESLEKYNKWNNELIELESEEDDSKNKLTAANNFKIKINEAESIAINNIIATINQHVQKYLDDFFVDNPIMITLHSFKEDKKKQMKPQINIEVNYKEMDCDINTLSGGELQRVVIAFNLALSEMFNNDFLLLDECTSNLDQELTNTIMNSIKSSFPDKKVIIIAHQVVTGIFETIIRI